jgi:hypothetical protein
MGFSVLSLCTIAGLIVGQQDNNIPIEACIVAVIVAALYSLWALFVIATTASLTISGVFARYCYSMGDSNGQTVELPLKNPTLESAKRALTTSFGTCCLLLNIGFDIAQVAFHGKDHGTARKETRKYLASASAQKNPLLVCNFFLVYAILFLSLYTDFATELVAAGVIGGRIKSLILSSIPVSIGYMECAMVLLLFNSGAYSIFVCL